MDTKNPPKLTRDELIDLLKDHIGIRVKVGREYTYGGIGPRLRIELYAHGTISEDEQVISSDYIDLSDLQNPLQ